MITETIQYKQLVRMRGLAQTYRSELPAPARQALTTLTSELGNLATLAGSQASAEGKEQELKRAKGTARAELTTELAAIHRIARVIAMETPGFDDKFRMPRRGDEKLLAAARSFAENAEPASAIFVKHALPADFIKALSTTIENFEEAGNNYAEAGRASAAIAMDIQTTLQRALAASKLLDAIVRNTFRNDPMKLAEWDRACQSGIKRSRSTPTAAPATPA